MRQVGWALAVVGFVVAGSATASVDDARAAFDTRIRAALEERAPAVVPRWDAANAARDAGNLDEAAAGYRDVIAADPTFDHAHRRLCAVLSRQRQWDAAHAECRAALELDASALNHASVARTLVERPDPGPSRLAEAKREQSAADALAPDDFDVASMGAQVAGARGDRADFELHVRRMRRLAPDDPATVTMSVYLDLDDGDVDAARAELARARARLDPDAAAKLDAAIAEEEDRPTLGHLAWKFAKVLVGWAATFFALFVFGSLLSRATLKSTERADPTAKGEARGATRWIRRAYAVLLGITSVFFYVSLPLVALVVIALAGAVIYGVLAAGWIAPKLFLIVIVLAAASLWAIARSLFAIVRRPPEEDPGPVLDRDDHPALHAVIDEVGKTIGTRVPDKVFLTPGTSMAVFERGSTLRTLTGRGERCLMFGAGLLPGFRIGPFKSILAHELGHFKNEDTAGGATSLVVRRSLMEMIVSLARGGAAGRFNPAWLFVEGFYKVFLQISQGASRLQEVLADRWAVTAYGSANFVDGLKHVIRREVRFDAEVNHAVRTAVDGASPLRSLYRKKGKVENLGEVKTAVRDAIKRAAGPYDSHPSPEQRIAHALELAVTLEAAPEDANDVWTLLSGRAELERTLMERVQHNLRTRSGIDVELATATAAHDAGETPDAEGEAG